MRRVAVLLVVLGIATGARVVNVRWMATQPISTFQFVWEDGDMIGYWRWAGRIVAGDLLGREMPPPYPSWRRPIAPLETWERWYGPGVFYVAPLYAYVVAGMRALAGDQPMAIALCHLALGVLNVALVFLLAARYFDTPTAAVAGLVAALYGPALLYETLLLRDTLAVTLSLGLLLALSRCETAALRPWFVAGCAFGVAVLGRELVVPFAAGVALWIVQRFRARPVAGLRVGAAFALGVALALVPLVARNLAVGVAPLAFSAGGLENIVYGHAVDTRPARFEVPVATAAILQAADGNALAVLRGTLATYAGNWALLARNEAARAAAIFSPLEGADNVNWYYFAARSPMLGWALRWEAVLAFGLVGIVLARRRVRRDDRIVLYYLVVSLAGLQLVPVMGRFRLVPAMVLAVYAGVALVTIGRGITRGAWRSALGPAVASAALMAVSTRLLLSPGIDDRCRPSEYLMAAQMALARQDGAGMYAALQECLECARRHADADVMPSTFQAFARDFVVLGRRMGRAPEAAGALERLARTYPADPVLPGLLAQARAD